MRVLHVIYSMNPVYGGTVEALRQLVKASESSDQRHEILCLDDPEVIAGIGSDMPCLHAVGPTKRFYGHTSKLDAWLGSHLRDFQCAVIHGRWQYHGLATFRACRRQGIPYLQYPHGMLDPWCKRKYPLKHLKKWLYWPWAEYRILKNASRVVFTCEEEECQAAKSFWLYRVNPVVIPLGIKLPDLDLSECKSRLWHAHSELKGKRMLTFMSRIHEKKGVDLLIEAAIRLQNEAAKGFEKLTLVIAGPCGDVDYLASLKERASALSEKGPIESILWLPMVRDEVKWGLLAASEAFILPSHQENFGMVVAEALACGTPVLLSDKVNIWREVVQSRAAFVEPDTLDGTKELLRRWLALEPGDREAMRAAASACFTASFAIERNAARLFELIETTCDSHTYHETDSTGPV
jgi:glycosyltransferase involved in cell wall biosynthesis